MERIYALRLVRAMLSKKLEERPTGGYKTTLSGKEYKGKYTEILAALEEVEATIHRTAKPPKPCKGCEAFQCAPNSKVGWCFPKDYTSTRKVDDFCSLRKEKHE